MTLTIDLKFFLYNSGLNKCASTPEPRGSCLAGRKLETSANGAADT
jgi:hypothetical protein